jgi:integrase/recombinase XerD
MGEKLIEPLSEDEMRAMLKAADGKDFQARRDTAILRVLFNTGLRANEVIALTLDDVDLGAGVVTVRKSKVGRGRVVGIGPQTAQAIDRYIRLRRTHRLADSPALWLGSRGRTFAYAAMWDSLKGIAKAAGVTRWHPHLARHTAASRWLERGGSEGGLMAVGGWSQRSMMDRYSRATASQRAVEEARKIDLGDL